MKKNGTRMLLVSIALSISSLAFADGVMNSLDVPQKVSADKVVIHVGGMLPNTCYSISPFEHAVAPDGEGGYDIFITADSTVADGYCLMIVRPVSESLVFTKLDPGSYQVKLYENNRLLLKQKMIVTESASDEGVNAGE